MVPGALEVVSVPRPGAEQTEKSESRFHARDYTLSVYMHGILREEEMSVPSLGRWEERPWWELVASGRRFGYQTDRSDRV